MSRRPHALPFGGIGEVTILQPQPPGWRNLFRPGLAYDFQESTTHWRQLGHLTSFIVNEAAQVDFFDLPRQICDVMATETGHLAVGGPLTGWHAENTPLRGLFVIPLHRLLYVGEKSAPPAEWPELYEQHLLLDNILVRLTKVGAVIDAFEQIQAQANPSLLQHRDIYKA